MAQFQNHDNRADTGHAGMLRLPRQDRHAPSISLLSETTDKRRRVPRRPLFDSFKDVGAALEDAATDFATVAGDEGPAMDALAAADRAGLDLKAMARRNVTDGDAKADGCALGCVRETDTSNSYMSRNRRVTPASPPPRNRSIQIQKWE